MGGRRRTRVWEGRSYAGNDEVVGRENESSRDGADEKTTWEKGERNLNLKKRKKS